MNLIILIFGIVIIAYLFFRYGRSEQAMDDRERNEVREKRIENIFKEYKEHCNTLYCLLGNDAKIIISDAKIRRSLIRDLCKNSKDGDLLSLGDIINLEINYGLSPIEVEKMELDIICFHVNVSMFVEVEEVKEYLQKKLSGT